MPHDVRHQSQGVGDHTVVQMLFMLHPACHSASIPSAPFPADYFALLGQAIQRGPPLTILLPSEDAMHQLPDSQSTPWLSNPALLAQVLMYHLLPQQMLMFADLVRMAPSFKVGR